MTLPFVQYILNHPPALILVIIISTYISEDVAIISTAALTASGDIPILLAIISLLLGITSGDASLYWLGYLCKKRITFIDRQLNRPTSIKLQKALSRNMAIVILSTRFMPGFRLPCYLLCGMYRLSFTIFLVCISLASVLWIVFIFSSMNTINKLNGPISTWITALILIVLLQGLRFLIKWYLSTRNRKH